MIDKEKVRFIKDRIKQLIDLNQINGQLFIMIFDEGETFTCGYGCPKCTNLALLDFIETNADFEHNCGDENEPIDIKKVN